MRDPARIDVVLAKLGELWKQSPDLRLGQLVETLADAARQRTPSELRHAPTFYIEDTDMLVAISERLADQ